MENIYSFDYYTESWIEVCSQPSSSSLSSINAEEIVQPGLRLQNTLNNRRRRRLHRSGNVQPNGENQTRPLSAAGSSQEEYEESESESDRLLSSSNEDVHPQFAQEESPPATSSDAQSTSDDDENSTALGINTVEPVFTPQPNAFSHPPASRAGNTTSRPESYFPTQRQSSATDLFPNRSTASASSTQRQRHSYPTHHQPRRSHTPYNMISPSYTADHDAALRASLSTLLSCAAAARGLPKREASGRVHTAGPSNPNRIEPSSIRMVSESTLRATESSRNASPMPRRASFTSSISPSSGQGKGKRKSVSRDRRDTKKKRRSSNGNAVEEILISPTLMTWLVSAGVVVLFSAISFSAGFAYGKEVGRMEAVGGSSGSGITCAKEVGKGYVGGNAGLKRLRWGNGSVVRA